MVALTNHVIPGPDYITLGPWHFKDFCKIFLPSIGEEEKKSFHLSAGLFHCAIWLIRP